MRRRSKRPALLPDETFEQLRTRLRRFALATRAEAMRAVPVPFPEHMSVLAGPRRIRRSRRDGISGQPEAPAAADRAEQEGGAR